MAAPIGNKNAEGNEGGRPPIHTDPEKVGFLVHDYFQWIEGEQETKEEEFTDKEGNIRKEQVTKWLRYPEPPTVTGLALHLGFSSKSTLYEYVDKIEFSDSIKKGLTRIEKYHEIKTAGGDKCVGNIFVLKNFGWKDTQEVSNKHSVDKDFDLKKAFGFDKTE